MLVLNLQAALATKWKEPPRHALDAMILITGLKLPQAFFAWGGSRMVLKQQHRCIESMQWAGGRCMVWPWAAKSGRAKQILAT